MLERDDVVLVVVDVQERMMPAIHQGEMVINEVVRVILGCTELGIPMLVTEQYSKGLGPTVDPVRNALGIHYEPIEKTGFSACTDLHFMQRLETANRQHVILCGVETHVCIYQTASDLIQLGWEVQIVTDAVGSRKESNKALALTKMPHHGVDVTSVEMVLFEMMVSSDIPEFKRVSQIVK